MKKRIKHLSALFLAGILSISSLPVAEVRAEEKPAPVLTGMQEVDANDIVILYTNDVHNAYSNDATVKSQGYASLAWLKNQVKAKTSNVALVDNGDAIQGDLIGTLSKGSYIVDIMNKVGYDVAIPGNHEFDFGMDNFLEIANKKANYKYVSCNFMDLKTNKPALDAYTMKSYTVDGEQVDVAFVGISTPETFTKSTPTYFQDDKGNYIYGFCEGDNGDKLAAQVQASVDKAKADGAEYVIALAHLGVDESSSPYTSREIIGKTNGIDALLDGHSHTMIPSDGQPAVAKNKDGKDVVISSTGEKSKNFGELVIDTDEKTIVPSLVSNITEEDSETKEYIKGIEAKFADLKNEKVATTDVDLLTTDPETGKRLVRKEETNLGDLCADAYFALFKDYGVDCAFVNGGGIRADIKKGDITAGTIYSVHPFGNAACLVEASGQQILDALEMSARGTYSEEIGGFLQVSGMSYDVDTTIESTVVLDDKQNFVKVAGARRVQNVKIQGKAIDPNKTYKVASHNYALKSYGDGMTMFKGAKILQDEMALDNELLRKYITEDLGGKITASSKYANPYGEGRIRIIASKSVDNGCLSVYHGSKEYTVGHTPIHVAKQNATCTKDGVKEYYKCSYCDKKFADRECKTAVKDSDLVIKAGHQWDNGKVTKKPTTTKTGTKKYTCKHCKATKTVKLAKLKKQSLKLSPASKAYKVRDLKKAKKTFKLKVKGAKTSVSYKVTSKKAAKYISVSKSGLVTVKKGARKGTYYITVTAKETLKYAKASKTLKIVIK